MKRILCLFIIILFVSGCGIGYNKQSSDNNKIEDRNKDEQNEQNEEKKLEDIILETMTLEEKVAQLFIIDLSTFNNGAEVIEMSMELKNKSLLYPIGGFIFFSNNIANREQVMNLIRDLQQDVKIPFFISVDEEGGRVSRLGNNKEIGMTSIPQASKIATLDDASKIFSTLGKELKEIGFNMDFAPVADVNTNPNNPVIGDRAFSSDPLIVAAMVGEAIKALQEQGVASVVKHFPGHGDTLKDTHTGTAIVEHDKKRLESVELMPFNKAIEEDAVGIMVAHIALPNVTFNDIPASLSNSITTELLRNQMKYEGLVITDALNMKAISEHFKSDEACIKAVLAGVDMLLMPEDFELAYKGIIEAVQNGEISEDRINNSVKRILKAKIKLNIIGEDIKGGK